MLDAPSVPVSGGIVKGAPLPYYAQLAELLRAAIDDGTWQRGQLLPSEAELCSFFGISRTAVRQALGLLAAEGLVRKEKGRGTFVTGATRTSFVVQELRGFADEMTEQGKRVDTEVLAQEAVEVPPELAGELGVPVGSEVLLLERVRSADAEPLCLVRTYLPLPRFAALADVDFTRTSLYDALRDRFGVEPRSGERTVEAVAADRRTARLLGVPERSPVLHLSSTNVDQDGRPFEAFTAAYRGDRTSFRITLGPAT